MVEGTEQCDDGNLVSGDGCSATCLDETLDSDGDGIPNIYETGTGIYVSPTNTGTNPNTPDSDGDGLSDGAEILAGTNPNTADTDGDGRCDGPSAPAGPGACTAGDNCPLVANASQADADSDGRGDACDNCRFVPNPSQSDLGGVFTSGSDGIGDACQCGDVTDAVHAGPDGAVSPLDVAEVRLFLAGSSTHAVERRQRALFGRRRDRRLQGARLGAAGARAGARRRRGADLPPGGLPGRTRRISTATAWWARPTSASAGRPAPRSRPRT